MFPNVSFFGIDLYVVLIMVGIIAAILVLRFCSGEVGMSSKVFNFSLMTIVVGIVVGYLSAVLFQSWYAFLDTGVWEWGAGATFYGGLIGGAGCVLLLYFVVGHFYFKDNSHIAQFNKMISLAIPCVVLAHAFGRIGCLLDGCCYGAKTDAWFGIDMYIGGAWEKRVPVQLFEALFLFALFAALMYLLLKRKNGYTASIYLIAYGVWRFFIEYLRDDARGSSGIDFLSPSQLTAIIMVVVGVVWFLVCKFLLDKYFEKVGEKVEKPHQA